MNKVKISVIMAATILISLIASPIIGAVYLDGDIEAEILPNWVGLIIPKINISENQTKMLNIDYFPPEDNNSAYYKVNDTLTINISTIGEAPRDVFLLPRSVYVSVFVLRKDVPLFPIIGLTGNKAGLFTRMMAGKTFERVDVIPGFGQKEDDQFVNVSLKYRLEPVDSENLTVHIFVMGLVPGDLNGGKILPVHYQKVDLLIDYPESWPVG
jgi:hypothetical protein